MIRLFFVFNFLLIICWTSCGQLPKNSTAVSSLPQNESSAAQILTAADQTELYVPLLQGKKVGMVVNQTSCIGKCHLVDSLLQRQVNITAIFAPEHGFRGDADAGENVSDNVDAKTGIAIRSIYGKNKKPSVEQLQGIDVMVFDIQDVGVRFYTYISTMHYVMEACAENSIPLLVLDRPNPNGRFVDGPVLDVRFRSFVGMHPIPVLHGLTVGELAQMINEEGWLANGVKCALTVIPCQNWTHHQRWHIAVPPSPNLPNDQAVQLYASLCLFEATEVSVGRGTKFPFQVVGYPEEAMGKFSFVPQKMHGAKIAPLQEGKTCYGFDLQQSDLQGFSLQYLLYFRDLFPKDQTFITRPDFFNKLVGNDVLLKQLEKNASESEIRSTWQIPLDNYKKMREKYLLYP
ncbi:MAG: DUF1343 domain-containing protein [Bacteroidales bacterium]|nr:DUF1343 domain-containing protein [Bacteroidales bacterium]